MTSSEAVVDEIRFDRDIAPIFATHCYECHGPDSQSRVTDWRLDRIHNVVGRRGDTNALIMPGDVDRGVLIQRIRSVDDNERMPPPEHSEPLADEEVALIESWIDQGAPISDHWSRVAPKRPNLPEQDEQDWSANPIDHFILQRLNRESLIPSPRANRYTLLRRISLDLTGLPPTPAEINRFLDDDRPDAWNSLIERLLASPSFGERMAQPWLDAARFADTTGHAADMPRTSWLYRDWVIEAFNQNMPFDQFTIEQLAGDLLPEPSPSQLIATGFHRNSIQALGNNPRKEEFRIKGVVDRLETTGRVWLGMTVGCAECHDHKYDPLSQREYYELFAIFNNVPHYGERFDVHGPRIEVIPPSSQMRIDSLQADLDQREYVLSQAAHEFLETQVAIEKAWHWLSDPQSFVRDQQFSFHLSFENDLSAVVWLENRHERLPFGEGDDFETRLNEGPWPGITAFRLAANHSLQFDATAVPNFESDLSVGLWINTTSEQADLVSQYDWMSGRRSYVFGIGGQGESGSRPGALYAWVSSESDPFNGIEIYGSVAINDGEWHHVAMCFDAGSSISLYVDGIRDPGALVKGTIPNSIAESLLPLAIGGGYAGDSETTQFFLDGSMADVRIVDRVVSPSQLGAISAAQYDSMIEFAASRLATVDDKHKLWIESVLSGKGDDSDCRILQQQIAQLQSRRVVAQVMDELPEPRETFIHLRGDFENRGEQVEPGWPDWLADPLAQGETVDRLALAYMLVDRSNPLTARVIANRLWLHFFGTGLVRTADDFGSRGEYPSHPELLDWLAVELMESNWDLKHLIRLIVSSSVYQQSSDAGDELWQSDPQNRLLARGPRKRLEAEQIRDIALSASGVRVNRIGGPSVFPPQDPSIGQFRDSSAGEWLDSSGEDRFRRAVYTFWQRMSPYPSMVLFDAPSRERCSVMRVTTNTPLQALVGLNDPLFVELARHFGNRIQAAADSDHERIRFAFLVSLGRPPDEVEHQLFLQFVDANRDDESWFRVAQVLLNLDETISKH